MLNPAPTTGQGYSLRIVYRVGYVISTYRRPCGVPESKNPRSFEHITDKQTACAVQSKTMLLEAAAYLHWSNLCYEDIVGVWTVGYGPAFGGCCAHESNLGDGTQLFKKDLHKLVTCVNNNVRVSLVQYQFDALVSVAYNYGYGGFTILHLFKYVNTIKFQAASASFTRLENLIRNAVANNYLMVIT
jgi:lysozyme